MNIFYHQILIYRLIRIVKLKMDYTIDRIKGCIFGGAIGDAFGAPFEFSSRLRIKERFGGKVTDFVDAPSVFGDKGSFTDDTEMALCIVDAIIEDRDVVPETVVKHFIKWYEDGPTDIGLLTRQILHSLKMGVSWKKAARDVWLAEGGDNPNMNPRASNGSLMRCAPIGVFRYNDISQLVEDSIIISQTTHYDPRCCYSNVIHNYLISENIRRGNGPDNIELAPIDYTQKIHWIMDKIILNNSPRLTKCVDAIIKKINQFKSNQKTFEEISHDYYDKGGYVLDSLSISLISFCCTTSFDESVIEATNFGSDNDTTGAINGALAGSYYGYSNIPATWLQKLQNKHVLEEKTNKLIEIMSPKA
ncbi:MAG: hypothetical protein GF364_21455 [Candidatus Lokiarchaeota archaeon]|nr:hypothetical protein [Candidatus Lokiarchaeota archaeon]